MANLRTVRNRIESVGKIQKIADALEVVALTRLRHMERDTIAARDYFERIRQMLFDLTANINFKSHPLLAEHKDMKSIAVVSVFSDKGLCGDFNANVGRRLSEFIQRHSDKNIKAAVIGKKGARYIRMNKECDVISMHAANDNATIESGIAEIAESLIEAFLKEDIGEIYLLYSKFRLHLLGEAKAIKLIPFTLDEEKKENKAYQRDYIYEPGSYGIFEALIREYVANQIHQGLLESRCAEEMSRMLAMKAATDNADEMIGRLKLLYNKSRQAQITKELTEVIAATGT